VTCAAAAHATVAAPSTLRPITAAHKVSSFCTGRGTMGLAITVFLGKGGRRDSCPSKVREAMRVKDILKHKGHGVTTIRPDAACRELLALLAEHNIGAAVVTDGGETVGGIVSERDIVRRLHERGDAVLDGPVSAITMCQVSTCAPDDRVDEVRETMTERRIRHLPVVEDGRLLGIVSIGDVVKASNSELEFDRQNLIDYVQG
jgi:CBS domain-containing protein